MRREITIGGYTETSLSLDSVEFTGMTHSEIVSYLKNVVGGTINGLNVEIDETDLELAAYQILGDLT